MLLFAGCHQCDTPLGPDRCADIAPGAMPLRPGTFACQWQTAQMERGEQSKYVVHQYEWSRGGKELGPEGRRHIEQMARRLPHSPYMVVISPNDDDSLNEIRRAIVVQHLAEAGVTDAPNRVVIAKPEGEGLYGPEAARYGAFRAAGISGFGQQGGQGANSGMGGGIGGMNSNSMSGGLGTSGVGGGAGFY
jgi:hypothetical protein